MTGVALPPPTHSGWRAHPKALLAAVVVLWLGAYRALGPLSEQAIAALSIDPATRHGASLQFFLYDAPKVLLLLSGVVFGMGIINSYFTPERTRALLAGRTEGVANILAALLGVVRPFCSCSAVPLFVGFVQAGVPLGVTFSFLVSAPMVNEIALTLLFSLFGWRVGLLYLVLGLSVAIVSGWILGRLHLEHLLEAWVREMPRRSAAVAGERQTFADRIDAGRAAAKEIVGRVWPYVVGGIAVGALIHGFVPQDYLASFMGKDAWWSVPLAVIIGVPLYSNAAGIIPIVQALLAKGASLGTVLAFMMSVIGLSLPELVILRKVLTPRLIAAFVSVVAAGILLVGYVFNAVL